jgi:hypothetical protein
MEFMHSVSASNCCAMNYRQRFLHKKTLLLRQEFWSLSFEDHRTYGLDIPRRLHMRGNKGQQKFTTIQGVNIYETAWYLIIGLSRSTYMLYKSNNKQGWFLPHSNKSTHKL